jgi:hypothetical protein
MNITVPVAPVPVTVAVKVTELPYVDGLADDATPVVVDAMFTVCARTDDVDPVKFESPLYVAVMLWVATLSADVL